METLVESNAGRGRSARAGESGSGDSAAIANATCGGSGGAIPSASRSVNKLRRGDAHPSSGLRFWRIDNRNGNEVWVTKEKFDVMHRRNYESVEKFLSGKPNYQKEKARGYRASDPEAARRKSRERRAKNLSHFREMDRKRTLRDGERRKAQARARRAANIDKFRAAQKAYRQANLERERERARIRYYKNKELGKLWYKNSDKYKTSYKAYRKKRRESDPIFRFACTLRVSLFKAAKKIGSKKDRSLCSILGCTPRQFASWIEAKFKPGMTWNNWGRYGWHLDHIHPVSKAKTKQELLTLFHYTNFQPLWWLENIKKRDKMPHELASIRSGHSELDATQSV